MLKRDASDDPSTNAYENKRLRACFDETAEEFACPITCELPVDPVTAEDGRVYERRAITQWLSRPGLPTSPVTNEPMGRRLMPARQVRCALDRMVRSGVLVGPKVDAWSRKLMDEQIVATVRRMAEEGDGEAMAHLAHWYYRGEKGLPVDPIASVEWYGGGHDAGDLTCTTQLGTCHARGIGVERDASRGVELWRDAAERGSQHACFILGGCFAVGRHGVSRDASEAARWYRAMADATHRDAPHEQLERAEAWLREHDEAGA